MLLLDTDLVSTVVYARHYYGTSSPWLEREARARRADLYLLCDVDVPWIPDGIRDRPEHRAAMHARFRDALEQVGARVVDICGDWNQRWTSAHAAAASLYPAP